MDERKILRDLGLPDPPITLDDGGDEGQDHGAVERVPSPWTLAHFEQARRESEAQIRSWERALATPWRTIAEWQRQQEIRRELPFERATLAITKAMIAANRKRATLPRAATNEEAERRARLVAWAVKSANANR